MYFASAILLIWTYIVSHSATSYALLVPSTPSSLPSTSNKQDGSPSVSIVQQYFALEPPVPILEIGYKHIINQLGENMTAAENQSISNDHRHPGFSIITSLRQKVAPAECGLTSPCVDGSCCNSVSLLDHIHGGWLTRLGRKMWLYPIYLQGYCHDHMYLELRCARSMWI
jgi:hypothetical protein